jgi:hypothetical protein
MKQSNQATGVHGQQQNNRATNNPVRPNQSARVNTTQRVPEDTSVKSATDQNEAFVNEVIACERNVYDVYDSFIDTLCSKITVNQVESDNVSDCNHIMRTSVYHTEVDVCNDSQSDVVVEFAQLHRVDLNIKGVECNVKCLEDSGAQIGIIRSDIISDIEVKRVGTVKLRGIFGSSIEADLVQLYVKVSCCEDVPYIPVIVAMCDSVYEEMLLSSDTIDRLLKSPADTVSVTNASLYKLLMMRLSMIMILENQRQLSQILLVMMI